MARRFFGEQKQYKDRFGFRWRSSEVSRIEGFSDAVFAFSVTLLIVSLEVPRTFAELLQTMQGFAAFAASFAFLIWIWHIHYVFFRRYGLQDAFTKTVNAVLLFVVLFYVYPLKFVVANALRENTTTLGDGRSVPIVAEGELSAMMTIYAIGFIAVFFCYALLYWNARRKREELRLNPVELFVTTMHTKQYILCIVVGLISLSLAMFGGHELAAWSAISYALLVPVLGVHGFMSAGKQKRIEGQMQQQYQQHRPPHQQRHGDQQRPQHGQRRPQGGQRPHGGHQRQQGQQHPRDQRNQQQRRPGGSQSDQSQQPRKPE